MPSAMCSDGPRTSSWPRHRAGPRAWDSRHPHKLLRTRSGFFIVRPCPLKFRNKDELHQHLKTLLSATIRNNKGKVCPCTTRKP